MNKSEMGKKSRQAGARFELRVRVDLEKKGWIIDKWSNNVEFICNICKDKKTRSENSYICEECGERYIEGKNGVKRGKLVKVKNKFLGPGRPMMLGAGFPDFIAFKICDEDLRKAQKYGSKVLPYSNYEVIGVESKMRGVLDKQEKEKCKWLLSNNIFSKILIAQKGEKRGEIIYKEFS